MGANAPNLANKLRLATDRAAGFGVIARTIFLLDQPDTRALPAPSFPVIKKYLEAPISQCGSTLSSGFQAHVRSILDIIIELATHPQYAHVWRTHTKSKTARLSPVEFALISVFISEYKQYPIGTLAGHIARLRETLHTKHKGHLQVNNSLFASYRQFLFDAEIQDEGIESLEKRKIRDGEESDGEYQPEPSSRKRIRVAGPKSTP